MISMINADTTAIYQPFHFDSFLFDKLFIYSFEVSHPLHPEHVEGQGWLTGFIIPFRHYVDVNNTS